MNRAEAAIRRQHKEKSMLNQSAKTKTDLKQQQVRVVAQTPKEEEEVETRASRVRRQCKDTTKLKQQTKCAMSERGRGT
jgi:hypothetical protein